MEHTVINLEDTIGKTVGRRAVLRDAIHYGMDFQRTASQLSRSLGGPRYPRGPSVSILTKKQTHG